MHAADALVVPLLPTPLSARTLEQLFEFIASRRWRDVDVVPFFSMVDRRRSLHKATIAELRGRFPAILQTEVPYGSEFERMAARRAPIESYAPASAAARDLPLVVARDRRAPDVVVERAGHDGTERAARAPTSAADSDFVGSPWSAGRA